MLDGLGSTREHWTRNLKDNDGPVAILRMGHLVDFDSRLTDPARVVYRFLIDWYHSGYGDALASVRHIVGVMRDRAPDGARQLSRSAVQRAVVLLIETGWLVRQYTGRGTAASRYVPVFNVLELASNGTFPAAILDSVPVARDTTDEPASVPVGWDSTVPVEWDTTAVSVPLYRDKDMHTGRTYKRCVPVVGIIPPVTAGAGAAAPGGGFEELLAAYDRPGEDAVAARQAFDRIRADEGALDAMITAAASWKRTARGKRMSLARWIGERRWEAAPAADSGHRWPSCVVKSIKPHLDEEGGFDGARVTFKTQAGTTETRVLNMGEYRTLQNAVEAERPAVNGPSDDLREFVGARFLLDGGGGFKAAA